MSINMNVVSQQMRPVVEKQGAERWSDYAGSKIFVVNKLENLSAKDTGENCSVCNTFDFPNMSLDEEERRQALRLKLEHEKHVCPCARFTQTGKRCEHIYAKDCLEKYGPVESYLSKSSYIRTSGVHTD